MSAPAALSRPTLAGTALLAVGLGLLAGLFQLALHALKRWGLGSLVLMTPQVVWMAPVAYVLLFVPPALLWWALGRLWPRAAGYAVPAAALAGLGAMSALQALNVELKWWAIGLLSLGLAAQAARLTRAGMTRWIAAARAGTPWMAAAVAVLGVGLNGARWLEERRAVAALPAPPPAGSPNVLFIILDTVRGLSLGLYGHDKPTTPRLDRFGREGVVFDRAVSPSSWTNPSHGSMFTGHHPHRVSSDWGSGLDGTHPTLAEALRDRGWLTGGFVGNTRYVAREGGLGRGFVHYDDHPRWSLSAVMATTWLARYCFSRDGFVGQHFRARDILGRKNAPAIVDPLLAWIPEPDGRPFFAMMNFIDAHDPYLPPAPFRTRFMDEPPRSLWQKIRGRLPGGEPPLSTAEAVRAFNNRERASYEGAIAFLDHELGRMFDELARRGQLDHTLVIVTSDHGEEFEEHEIQGHGKSLYWTVVQVPLLMRWPGRVPAGVRVREPVALRGIPVTVMDLLGLDGEPRFPGTPLARYWDGTPGAADTVLSELSRASDAPTRSMIGRGDMKSLAIGRWHYIRNGDGSEELYDIERDPWERENRIAQGDSTVLAAARAVMAAIPVRRRQLRQTF